VVENTSSTSPNIDTSGEENPKEPVVSDKRGGATQPTSETRELVKKEGPPTKITDEKTQPKEEIPTTRLLTTRPVTTKTRPRTREERIRDLIIANKKRKQTLVALFIANVAYLAFFLVYFLGYIRPLNFLKNYEFLGVATWLIPGYILASVFLGVILSKESKHKRWLWFLLTVGVIYTIWLLTYNYQLTPMWLKPYEYKPLGIWTWVIPDAIIYQIVIIIVLTRVPKETRVPWTIFAICLEYTAWLFLLYFHITPGIVYQYQYKYFGIGVLKPILAPANGFLLYFWIALILYNVLVVDFIYRAPKHQRVLWTLIVVGAEYGMWLVGYFVEIMPMLLKRYEVIGKYTWVYVGAVFFVILIGIVLNKAPKVIRQGPILKGLRNVYAWEAALGQLYDVPKGFEMLEFPEKKSGSIYSDSLIQIDENTVLNLRTLLGKMCYNCDWQYNCKHADPTAGFLTELPCPPRWL
jgi:hypothetical protein